MEKVTMKIDENAHKKLQLAKAYLGSKTYSDAIDELAKNYLERLAVRKR